jgi:putative chitinase
MSLKSLQSKIGVTADGVFGPGTLKATMLHYKLSPIRAAHFFAQTGHETGNFKLFTENLNYSATALNSVFGKYFKNAGIDATQYERKPEKIANRVYASRMGNGDEASGDGWTYRGRGALQLTGKDNYKAFATYLKNPNLKPDEVADEYAFESAFFFFDKNNLWNICDAGVNDDTILKLTKRINGGINGLDHRKELTYKYYNWVK